MKVKVTIKVTADGQEVAKEKVVGDVTGTDGAIDLRGRAVAAVNRISNDLRRKAGV